MMNMGQLENGSAVPHTHDLDDLELDGEGRFSVVLSPERPAGHTGDWWPLDPRTRRLLMRKCSCDWTNEVDARVAIERLDDPGADMTPEESARRFSDMAEWIKGMIGFDMGLVRYYREHHGVNTFLRSTKIDSIGGLPTQAYYDGIYEIDDDEALVVETELPKTSRYWQALVADDRFCTVDWVNRQSSLNDTQARVDSDGRFRFVVSKGDPGVPNWLDKADNPWGIIQMRFNQGSDYPDPTIVKVKLSEVRDHLPADTPVVTPERAGRGPAPPARGRPAPPHLVADYRVPVSTGSRAAATSAGRSSWENSAAPAHDLEAGVGEGGHHLLGPRQREERVLVAPHQLDGHVDAAVDRAQVVHACCVVEAAQQPDRRRRRRSGRSCSGREEELVELAVEQRPVGEGVAEDELVAAQPSACRRPSRGRRRSRAGSGPARNSLNRQLRPVATARCRPGPWPAGGGRRPRRGGRSCRRCRGPRPRRRRAPSRSMTRRTLSMCWSIENRVPAPKRLEPVPGQVDHVAGDVVDQVRQQRPERGAAHRPAVHEQHVGARPHPAVGDLARPDVEEAVGLGPEQVGGCGGGERRHRVLRGSVRGSTRTVRPAGPQRPDEVGAGAPGRPSTVRRRCPIPTTGPGCSPPCSSTGAASAA